MNPSADHNLLFGILALQMDFIRRDDLIAAMNAWVLDKAKPLGQILTEQQALPADKRDLLEALVQAHLQMHDNDPQQSLAAVRPAEPLRQQLQQLADPDLEASLARVPATPDLEGDQPGATSPYIPPSTSRYQVLRPHARGGLGEVFVARDSELNREVALKEIQHRHADSPESRARFLLEAEVTGGLEHPGIVPVYGLGSYGDGRPFYAMRFIRGDSLKEAIARFHQAEARGRPAGESALELRQLLGRFLDVCNAIAYAHSRGVLHRDLKPGNVMVGQYGETLVVDWGLAKVVDRADIETAEGPLRPSLTDDSAMTRTGAALGTPAYMSPEQAAGRLDQLGPASDVYSLGATLYCLLTGKAPFSEGDAPEVLRQVQRGEFPPPRQINRRVASALEAVCLKAMALRPGDRYPSPKALAEDLEHWLADEPVAAYREPLSVRLGRWLRHHQTLTAAVGALLLTGVIALAISTLLVGQAQRETAAALRQEEQARKQEEQARKERAVAQVDALLSADPQAVSALLAGLEPTRADVLPRLRHLWAAPEESNSRVQRGRVGLALLSVEPDAVRGWLATWMLQAPDPREMVLLRDALAPHAAGLRAGLWAQAGDNKAPPDQRFRALVALAAFDPQGEGWSKHADLATEQLLGANTLHLGTWLQALRPVGGSLLKSLAKDYREAKSPQRREFAATVVADYAARQPDLLADLLLDADPKQYAVLFPVLQKYRDQAIERLRREVRGEGYWNDPPLDPGWAAPGEGLRREIEAAEGILAERWALTQSLPLGHWAAVAEGLRACGYRPVRLRPWEQQGKVQVAAVWARDGRPFQALTGLTAAAVRERDAALRKDGLLPAEVAGYTTGKEVRFAAVWVKPVQKAAARILVGVSAAEHQAAHKSYKDERFFPLAVQSVPGSGEATRFCGVWWNGGGAPKDGVVIGEDEDSYKGRVLLAEQLLVDVSITPGNDKPYASVWNADPNREAAESHGLSVAAHLQRCRELAAQGYRPAALSVSSGGAGKTVTASAWHRPFPKQPERERLARRLATAAVALLQLEAPADAWPLYRHRPDPEARSQLVWRGGLLRLDPLLLIKRLDEETDVSARRALILALGEYTGEQLPAAVRKPLTAKLLAWYRDDPSPGVHGAIDWLLRHGKEGPLARPLDWGQAKALQKIDQELRRRDPDGKRRWYVNGQGQTLVLIPGPVEFRMGSPPWEADRVAENETPHRRRIGRSFALGSKAVTVEEFQRFLKDRPDVRHFYVKRFSPEQGGPIIAVSWYGAALYCRWLSEKEGIAQAQMCYPPMAEIEKSRDGVTPLRLPADYLSRTGYRLPTEAEWEYACRAGTVTSHSYGASVELLPRYAWILINAQDRAWPVGQKRPNDLGLFDLYGNVTNWCQEAAFSYPKQQGTKPITDKEDLRDITDLIYRLLRGGSFVNHALNVRSANRLPLRPSGGGNAVGFRVARTYP
jgi:formylglycine-generating enzyme required for sulfatase activity/tRNA A-37 threonylcarbamoyl transferase component Bud32